MERDTLREAQRPIKERYASDPRAALVTLRAEGRIGENVSCSVDTGRALVEAGLHPGSGGTGMQVCSGDLLLRRRGRCRGDSNAWPPRSAFRCATRWCGRRAPRLPRTLCLPREVPVGFSTTPEFEVEGALTDGKGRLPALTERYCVVQQTLLKAAVAASM